MIWLDKRTRRFIVYAIGMLVLALGLTLKIKANLGVSPIISVPYSISQITGYNFGDLTFGFVSVLTIFDILMH